VQRGLQASTGRLSSVQYTRTTVTLSDRQSLTRLLALLLQRVQLLPVSSAECERGFSCMNVNDTAARNRISIETLASLIFVKVNGPPPGQFNPEPYVQKWLQEGRHSSADPPTGNETGKPKTVSAWTSLFE